MLRNLLSNVWQRVPGGIRRWTVRATNTTFNVTAAGIVRNDDGKVLLLKHRFRSGSGWGIPGGFIEAGEQAEDALRREMREEISLELDQIRLFRVRTFRRVNQIEVVFVARALGEPHLNSVEVDQALWFSPSSFPEGLPSDQKKLIHQALKDLSLIHI